MTLEVVQPAKTCAWDAPKMRLRCERFDVGDLACDLGSSLQIPSLPIRHFSHLVFDLIQGRRRTSGSEEETRQRSKEQVPN